MQVPSHFCLVPAPAVILYLFSFPFLNECLKKCACECNACLFSPITFKLTTATSPTQLSCIHAACNAHIPEPSPSLIEHHVIPSAMVLTVREWPAEQHLRHDKHWRYVSQHTVRFWVQSFLADLRKFTRSHTGLRTYGLGLGLDNFRWGTWFNSYRIPVLCMLLALYSLTWHVALKWCQNIGNAGLCYRAKSRHRALFPGHAYHVVLGLGTLHHRNACPLIYLHSSSHPCAHFRIC